MMAKKNIVTKEIILENTLQLIHENNGIKDVTLRDIAKKTGCAHTNLYNYFNSLDDIFWESLGKVLIMMMDYAGNGIETDIYSEEDFNLVLSNIIDFSMDYPGWYKLIWSESIGGSPSEEVAKILQMPGEGFIKGIIKASKKEISKEKATFIGEILHGYLHGEVSKWIYNRSFIEGTDQIKTKILSNLKELYKVLIK